VISPCLSLIFCVKFFESFTISSAWNMPELNHNNATESADFHLVHQFAEVLKCLRDVFICFLMLLLQSLFYSTNSSAYGFLSNRFGFIHICFHMKEANLRWLVWCFRHWLIPTLLGNRTSQRRSKLKQKSAFKKKLEMTYFILAPWLERELNERVSTRSNRTRWLVSVRLG
jgi:hypothetical protein